MSDFTTGVTSRNPGAGTLIYQAKEQILDATQPTNMSDLYAFGGLILAVRLIFPNRCGKFRSKFCDRP